MISGKDKLDGECSGKLAFIDREGVKADAVLQTPMENPSCDEQEREPIMHEPTDGEDPSGPRGEWPTHVNFSLLVF